MKLLPLLVDNNKYKIWSIYEDDDKYYVVVVGMNKDVGDDFGGEFFSPNSTVEGQTSAAPKFKTIGDANLFKELILKPGADYYTILNQYFDKQKYRLGYGSSGGQTHPVTGEYYYIKK